ncbi:helix-turn-helix domain-containing protein [Prevotella sp.]|uniref:helix-turn-helix domain-containing protein n=1 Tax=Prevotella sp. TaxID=59823 RepID=UPI002648E51F|nr:helix-turn-helix transcriptional regulator [Prevotella sp.]
MYFCHMDELNHINKKSASEVIAALGKRFKEYRLVSRLTQKEVSEKSGVSVLTIRRFELGYSYNITMGNFISMLKAIDFTDGIADIMPEIPVSPYAMAKLEEHKPKRIRHGKQS